MPIYRHDRLPGGSHYIRETSAGDEAASAIVGGAASAAGWLIGSGLSGVRTLARNSQDRRLARAAAALEEASESEDDDTFLALATDFTHRYPQMPQGHAALAEALQRKGRYEAAIQAVDTAVQLGLDDTDAHMLRVDIYDDAGKPGKAIQELTTLTQSEIAEVRQISLLGRAKILMDIGDPDQALKDANDAIATLPDETAYFLRGHVYRNMGDLEKCLQDYSRAIQMSPEIPGFRENRAEVYEILGRLEEASADRAAAAAAIVSVAEVSPPSQSPPQYTEPNMSVPNAPFAAAEPLESTEQSSSRAVLIMLAVMGGIFVLLLIPLVLGLLGII